MAEAVFAVHWTEQRVDTFSKRAGAPMSSTLLTAAWLCRGLGGGPDLGRRSSSRVLQMVDTQAHGTHA